MSKFDKAVFRYDITEFSMFAHLTEARLKQSAVNQESVKGLIEKFDRFRIIIEGVVAKVGEIKGSHMLSDQGKAESCFTLVQSTLKDLEAARSLKYDDWVGSLMRQTDPASKTAEQMVHDAFGMSRVMDELKAQEIRASVADMNPLALAIKYKDKARLGDRRFIFAINEAPVDPLARPRFKRKAIGCCGNRCSLKAPPNCATCGSSLMPSMQSTARLDRWSCGSPMAGPWKIRWQKWRLGHDPLRTCRRPDPTVGDSGGALRPSAEGCRRGRSL